MYRCFGFSGFFGFFGLIGVAFLIEYAARRKAKTRVKTIVATPSPAVSGGNADDASAVGWARLSPMAIFGAALAPQFFVIFGVPFVMCALLGTQRAEATWWETFCEFGMLSALLGTISLVGTTILGWVAISQIRRSAGRVCGLRSRCLMGCCFRCWR